MAGAFALPTKYARIPWDPRVFVFAVCAAAFALRLMLIQAGPDIDGDVYGHFGIGLKLREDPFDVDVHWVWLPLWHYAFALLDWLGGGIQTMRWIDAVLSSLIPALLALLLHRAKREPLAVCAAALLSVASPFVLDHGQSGEPETVFCLLLLGAAWLWQSKKPAFVGLCYALACLLRYECWVLLPVLAYVSWREPQKRGWLAWLLPGLAVAAWVLVRWRSDGELLAFIAKNRAFVKDAQLHGVGVPEPLHRALMLYTARIPWLEWGPIVLAAPLGAFAFWRSAPRLVKWPALVLLCFITYGWVRGQHLGLPRHFFAMVPAFAWMMAEGVAIACRRTVGRVAVIAAMLWWLGWHMPHALWIVREYHVIYKR